MRVVAETQPSESTTGALPPPRVPGNRTGNGIIDWRTAVPIAAMVAVVAAVLTVLGLRLAGVAIFGFFWLLSGAVISIGLYARRSPQARMDARVGLRLGIVTGLLMLAATAVVGAGAGLVLRFGTHSLGQFDKDSAEATRAAQTRWLAWLKAQGQDQATQDKYVSVINSPLMTSPEMKAGTALFQLSFEGALLLLLSAGGGAFAGMLRARRRLVTRGDP